MHYTYTVIDVYIVMRLNYLNLYKTLLYRKSGRPSFSANTGKSVDVILKLYFQELHTSDDEWGQNR